MMRTFSYPFSAVVGQDSFKLALLLAAIDPAIGGVLVRGPRGVAKTTLARALAELTPGRFVELPLGATEERVTGTLDLAGALREGKLEFAPGLLARAHEGVLYVDEVNLLPDAIVDVLLDAAASGVNVVERDGVSHRHPARFVLVGTMNPDEGELRPQLIDRFGLAVNASALLGPAQRAEIVARRLDFDRDPESFIARHAEAQRALVERCQAARTRAQAIPLGGEALARVSERCFAAGVEGVRADLAMLRAARAHAAWHGRAEIMESDIEAVAELALSHRRTRDRDPEDGGGGSGSPSASGQQRAGSAAPSGSSSAAPTAMPSARAPVSSARSADSRSSDPAAGGDRGALPAVPVRASSAIALPTWLKPPKLHSRRGRRYEQQHRVRHKTALAPSRSIDWFATLANPRRLGLQAFARHNAAPGSIESADATMCGERGAEPRAPAGQHGAPAGPATLVGNRSCELQASGGFEAVPASRRGADGPASTGASRQQLPYNPSKARQFPSDAAQHVDWDLRFRRRPSLRPLVVVALDCSASMLRGGALAAAKGVVRTLLTAPGSARMELALIAFGGTQASACVARASGPRLERAVQQLGAGGGTPLRQALIDALALGRRADRRGATSKRLLLFSDGRSREPTADLRPLRDAFEVSVIDCERSRVRLGRARAIADELEARYTHVDDLLAHTPRTALEARGT